MTNTTLKAALELLINNPSVAHIALCEFSAEDNTPTLHLDLWRGKTLDDVLFQRDLNALDIVAEGHWDGGRSYSLQAI